MNPLVEIRSITKIYKIGEVEQHALRSVTLQVNAGEFLALSGSSGSGKTTLLNLIGGLDHPTSGQVLVAGQPLDKMNSEKLSHFRRETLGFVFQTFNLFPVLTALENVEYPLLRHSAFTNQNRRSRAIECLENVALRDQVNKFPNQMSGGRRQRVSVARALASRPKLIMADEPTANLDRANARALLELMRELNEKSGVTFIFSTHDAEIISAAKRVIKLSDGQIIK